MKELLKFLITNGDHGFGYDAQEAVYAAKEAGLVKRAFYVGMQEGDERRWGRNTLYVYELDDKLVGIEVYVMYNDDADNEVENVYPVESYEVVETRWREVSE